MCACEAVNENHKGPVGTTTLCAECWTTNLQHMRVIAEQSIVALKAVLFWVLTQQVVVIFYRLVVSKKLPLLAV